MSLMLALSLSACATAQSPQPTAVVEVPKPATTTQRLQPTAVVEAPKPAATAAEQSKPILLYKDIEQGTTPEGLPYLGSANAPLTLIDYSDFL
ncbi:MAG: hypothetical protein HC853_10415 [Anaerolineae bacterium]|nr:hypothetical protein [Anaerolineae bacterium]